ncbi:MAG: two-component system sensor histidine kinase FlrB [Alcanivorax sp.]|jgi:two-component system sensor histidine kinase FlrB
MNRAEPLSGIDLEEAFEVFNRVSQELDTSYKELESKVSGLTLELQAARTARLSDLAEKERLLHRLSSLISVLPGGVLIVDPRQAIRDANPEAIQLLGEPLISESWGDVLHRVSGNRELQSRQLHLSNGMTYSVVSRLLDSSGDHVVLITDVSEIHRLQGQLARKERLTALGGMAARLAHQIRTPLSSATLYLSQLGRQDLAAEQRRKICAKVSDRLSNMGNLLDSMLGFVRGDETPSIDVIYLGHLLQEFKSTVQPQIEKSGSTLAVPLVDDTLMILGDHDELIGALSNLAMNALEAMGKSVNIELWVGALNSDWLQIRVRDNGPGIPEEILDRIFDPFFTTRALGTGLGLAIVAMTISNHGGEVVVRNRPEGGAEFLIDLPIAKRSDSEGAQLK